MTKYVQDNILLKQGDVLFLYTDGVTEAENLSHEQFSEERLKDAVNRCEITDAKGLVTFIRNEVDLFEDGAEQFDDITMLALRIL